MPTMINNALDAYRAAATRGTAAGPDVPDGGNTAQADFGSMVRDMISDSIESGHQSERMSAEAVSGQADLSDVVMAVNNAELSLQMVVGVRDKVIQAYQEIIRMPI